jgi:phage shock protein B
VDLTVIGVLLCVIVLPIFMFLHYTTKWRELKGLSKEDERMLEDLWQDAQRMESRINTLEAILDDEIPDWRKRV